MGLDEELELQDIAEQAHEVGKLSPREYGKLRGVAPQLVYYYIRTKKLELEYCICGRRVVDVRAADVVFDSRRKRDVPDTRSDGEQGHEG